MLGLAGIESPLPWNAQPGVGSLALATIVSHSFGWTHAQPSEYSPSAEWISSEGRGCDEPQLVAWGPDVLNLWNEWSDGQADVYGRLFCPNDPPGAAQRINQLPVANQFGIQGAAHNESHALAVWQSDGNGSYDIYGRILLKSSGGCAFELSGSAFSVSILNGLERRSPQISTGVNDTYFVTWELNRVAPYDAFGGLFLASGEALSRFELVVEGDVPAWTVSNPYIEVTRHMRHAPTGDGFVMVAENWEAHHEFVDAAWHQYWLHEGGVGLVYYEVNGNTLTPRKQLEFGLFHPHLTRQTLAKRPLPLPANDTATVLLWDMPRFDADGTRSVFAQLYIADAMSALPQILRVNTYQRGDQMGVAGAVLELGELVVGWESIRQDRDKSRGLFAQILRLDDDVIEMVGVEFPVAEDWIGDQSDLSLAKTGLGFAAVWSGSDSECRMRVFGTTLVPVADVQPVPTAAPVGSAATPPSTSWPDSSRQMTMSPSGSPGLAEVSLPLSADSTQDTTARTLAGIAIALHAVALSAVCALGAWLRSRLPGPQPHTERSRDSVGTELSRGTRESETGTYERAPREPAPSDYDRIGGAWASTDPHYRQLTTT